MRIILASASPRRKELLSRYLENFEIIPSNIDERIFEDEAPCDVVYRLAYEKGIDVLNKNQDALVISSDTIVSFDNEILGKPKDYDDAYRMINLLNGKTHQVITGVFIGTKDLQKRFYVISNVKFKNNLEEDIIDYINTDEPYDKAGAYAIQGIGAKLIEKYDGDFNNIVGLPLDEVIKVLKEFGV